MKHIEFGTNNILEAGSLSSSYIISYIMAGLLVYGLKVDSALLLAKNHLSPIWIPRSWVYTSRRSSD